jgi:hypothetical protein
MSVSVLTTAFGFGDKRSPVAVFEPQAVVFRFLLAPWEKRVSFSAF